MTIADQIRQVRLNIEQYCANSGRTPEQVRLLAVSKTHPATAIQDAYESGITEFGESYLQEAINKIEACQKLNITWHFIGPLQSNKSRLVAEHFDWVQSVDSIKLLKRLNDQRPGNLKPLQICIQVNLFAEPQKRGVTKEQLTELLDIANKMPHITLRGIMVIPPRRESYAEQMSQFKQVAKLYAQLQQRFPQIDTLSMGMSNDMQAAIENNSSMVRVGTGIFGARGTPNK
ncbi:YggS family pyridoxal phosphate-dependent enzyme [Aliikangiella sp. IMCC44359]|uniref:YggS family pyridoxal phosphate-dependent enzyme n=1 Tax=Aliikangiella sp. IMCC44359 TaxID=3459125 RepID=UPI00403AB4DD